MNDIRELVEYFENPLIHASSRFDGGGTTKFGPSAGPSTGDLNIARRQACVRRALSAIGPSYAAVLECAYEPRPWQKLYPQFWAVIGRATPLAIAARRGGIGADSERTLSERVVAILELAHAAYSAARLIQKRESTAETKAAQRAGQARREALLRQLSGEPVSPRLRARAWAEGRTL